jgi:hypothetical protein
MLSSALYNTASDVHSQETEEEAIPLDLDATEWDVTMVYISEKGVKESREDRLLFRDKKFISQEYKDKGYSPTNYSATVEPDGSTKFGTMQIKGKETAFWKGTVRGETMDGSVHVQFPNGKNKTTYLNGKLVSGVLVPLGQKKPEPTPPPALEPTDEPQTVDETTKDAASEAGPSPASDKPTAVDKK